MRGADHRIAPAVENAVAMGFDAERATEIAKREIIAFPGRGDVTELVIDALLQAAPGGGDRAFPPLPPEMPENVAKRPGDVFPSVHAPPRHSSLLLNSSVSSVRTVVKAT